MVWALRNWLLSNILSSVIILISTMITLWIILWRIPKGFYAIVARLFRIKRCVIDVNHKIIRNNSELSTSYGKHRDIRRFISNKIIDGARVEKTSTFRTDYITSNAQPIVLEEAKQSKTWPSTDTVVNMTSTEETNYKRNPSSISARSNIKKRNFRQAVRSVTVKVNQRRPASSANGASSAKQYTTLNVPEDHPTHPAYQRVILDIYGKYLPLRKKRNRLLILMISTIVIATVIIAFCEGCLLASVAVYQDRPCPTYGDMECFHGSNDTYFLCKTGENIDFPLLSTSATCYRWIALDQSVSGVLRQIGVCAGLLTAFGSITEVLIRILFLVYQQRRGVANGMRRVLEKTVGVNNATQPFCHSFIKFPIRVPPPNFGLYRYPLLARLTIIGYIIVAVLTALAYIPLLYFRASVTSFTYIILLSTALLCLFTLVWVIWEVDEICRVLPGGCMNIKDILKSKAFKDAKTLLSTIDEEDQKDKIIELGSPEVEEESEPKKTSAGTKSQTTSHKEGTGLRSKWSLEIASEKSNDTS